MTYSTTEFIKKAREIHGDKYSYIKKEYVNFSSPTTIVCLLHGKFSQTPNNHINLKQGCPECALLRKKKLKYTTQEFIVKSKQVHKSKYDYTLCNYTGTKNKIIIICKEHGEFTQTPNAHLNGQGCPKCGSELRKENRLRSSSDFFENVNLVHGGFYDYDTTSYTGIQHPINITCPLHGKFIQRANDHLHKQAGCPLCNVSPGGYNKTFFENYPEYKTSQGFIYLIRLFNKDELFYKIGITKRKPEKRLSSYSMYNIYICSIASMNLYDAFNLEQSLLTHLADFKYHPVKLFSGHTECLNLPPDVVHSLIDIIEFNK